MKIDREQVYDKYSGLCGYSGTPLEDDWQVDHIIPKRMSHFFKVERYRKKYGINSVDDIENLIPCQKLINHYKGGMFLEDFKGPERLGGLHKRLSKLPKNPRTENGQKRKDYKLKIASYFGITPDKPFSGIFYFETLKEKE